MQEACLPQLVSNRPTGAKGAMDAPALVLSVLLCFMRVAQGIDLGAVAAAGAAAASCPTGGTGCELKICGDVLGKPEPETNGIPLQTNFKIIIVGLREVKGGSFGVDVQYVHS